VYIPVLDYIIINYFASHCGQCPSFLVMHFFLENGDDPLATEFVARNS
jgi:hypothetical protein